MSNLILDSLEIRNFRGLRELRIEKLGRANLIVGKNNAGKTSVLEALRLYANPGSYRELFDILVERDEIDQGIQNDSRDPSIRLAPIERLFHGREIIVGKTAPIGIGPRDQPESMLTITLELYLPDMKADASQVSTPPPGLYLHHRIGENYVTMPIADFFRMLLHLDALLTQFGPLSTRVINSCFLSQNGMKKAAISGLWDSISLTSLEEDVMSSLKIIAPEIIRLNLKPIEKDSQVRAPFVMIKGYKEPVPLRNLGDGMNRLFGISLALATAKGGLLLVDEIENGIHYSVMPDLWRFIFQTAQRLNVQVFATTHSWDCIKAFQKAASEDTEDEGVLIHLDRKSKNGEVRAVPIDERDLEIAVEGQIEVR